MSNEEDIRGRRSLRMNDKTRWVKLLWRVVHPPGSITRDSQDYLKNQTILLPGETDRVIFTLLVNAGLTQPDRRSLEEDIIIGERTTSLIYHRTKIGPRTDPFGTPDVTGLKEEVDILTETEKRRLVRRSEAVETTDAAGNCGPTCIGDFRATPFETN
ncbi:hypothetical protein J6590_072654 [Homalodisca vitripennis]|nr:hypothetical protein J6590_072654 [Homalodisca vitripennis]